KNSSDAPTFWRADTPRFWWFLMRLGRGGERADQGAAVARWRGSTLIGSLADPAQPHGAPPEPG
ncbi:MAG: hypothetical protein ACK49H_14885, partial [Burkholderiales bacterium]